MSTEAFRYAPSLALLEVGREATEAIIANGTACEVEAYGTLVAYGGMSYEDMLVDFGTLRDAARAVGLSDEFDARFGDVEPVEPNPEAIAAEEAIDAAIRRRATAV
jgi:hypothetical protein